MNIALIGTGNMAWFLAQRLLQSGHTVSGIYGRDRGKTHRLAREYGFPVYASLEEIHDGMDACILAVADEALESLCRALSFRETVLLHTSGAQPAAVLEPAARHYGVIWPVYSILRDDLPAHRNIPCAWQGNNSRSELMALRMAEAIGDMPFRAGSEQRRRLHLCAVLENNFINHLMAISEQICREQDLPVQVLQPILMQTFTRNQTRPAFDLQTGPARRGDRESQQLHLDLLREHPEWQRLYETISSSIEKMYGTGTGEK